MYSHSAQMAVWETVCNLWLPNSPNLVWVPTHVPGFLVCEYGGCVIRLEAGPDRATGAWLHVELILWCGSG